MERKTWRFFKQLRCTKFAKSPIYSTSLFFSKGDFALANPLSTKQRHFVHLTVVCLRLYTIEPSVSIGGRKGGSIVVIHEFCPADVSTFNCIFFFFHFLAIQ